MIGILALSGCGGSGSGSSNDSNAKRNSGENSAFAPLSLDQSFSFAKEDLIKINNWISELGLDSQNSENLKTVLSQAAQKYYDKFHFFALDGIEYPTLFQVLENKPGTVATVLDTFADVNGPAANQTTSSGDKLHERTDFFFSDFAKIVKPKASLLEKLKEKGFYNNQDGYEWFSGPVWEISALLQSKSKTFEKDDRLIFMVNGQKGRPNVSDIELNQKLYSFESGLTKKVLFDIVSDPSRPADMYTFFVKGDYDSFLASLELSEAQRAMIEAGINSPDNKYKLWG